MKGKRLRSILIIAGSFIGIIIILFGVLILMLMPSESVKNINTKDENIIQTFEKEFNVELVEDASILNMGKIKFSGFSPDGPSISYYSKIVIPESKLDEFKEKNYTPTLSHQLDKETFEYYIQANKKFSWWDFKFEEVECLLDIWGISSTTLIFCKPQNGNVTIYIRR